MDDTYSTASTPAVAIVNAHSAWSTSLHVADILWSCLITTPLTIFYWGGTWKLLDLFLLPDLPVASSTVSLAFGAVGCLTGHLFLPLLEPQGQQQQQYLGISRAARLLAERLGLYLLALCVLNFWRGVWNLGDTYIGTDPAVNGACLAAGCGLLLALRSLSTAMASPLSVSVDASPDLYRPETRFKVQQSRFLLRLMDILLSHLIISQLVVHVWRSLWNIFDASLLPDDILLSYYVSLGAGYGAAFILFLLQHPLAVVGNRLVERGCWIAMFILQELVHLVGVISVLLVWRGGWGLNRDFLLENSWEASLAHGLASLGLLITQTLSSVASLDVDVDAKGPGAQDFYYHIHYFRRLLRARQLRVQQSGYDAVSEDDDLLGNETLPSAGESP